jgi:SNF2 family DNA or RNA helicase
MRDFNYWKFCKEFCHSTDISIKGRTVTKYFGVKNLDKLKKYLRGKYLRRNSEDILELPDIIFKEVILDVKEVKGLEEEWKTFSGGIPISTAKKESAISKAPKTAEYVRELLDTGLKVLVFTDHPDVGDIISETLIGYRVGISSGKVNALNRQGLIDSFQAGKLDVLVATIGSSSTGFNITSTNHVVFNDISWVDADNYQAIKRVHRIGQKNRVIVHYLLGGAIDAMILKAVKSKKNTLLEVL